MPVSAPAGSVIQIRGLGYSIVPSENILHVGKKALIAAAYTLVEEADVTELEQLTFNLPEDLAPGEYVIFVTVQGEPSNADVILEVTL